MRFISRSPGYKFPGKKQEYEILPNGMFREVSAQVMCEFEVGATVEHEREIARSTFKFQGTTTDEGGVPIDPIWRVSAYDSDLDPRLHDEAFAKTLGFQNAAELKTHVEGRLVRGQGPENHIPVEAPKLAEPWVGYDRLTAQGRRTNALIAEKVAARVAEDGYTPEEIQKVLSYERLTHGRPEVVEALEALAEPGEVVAA